MARKSLLFWKVLVVVLIVAVLVLGVQFYRMRASFDNAVMFFNTVEDLVHVGSLDSQHIHADFKVYINGEYVDVNKPEFQQAEFLSEEYFQGKHNLYTHVHAGVNNTDVLHVHATGLTFQHFFNSLGMFITPDCVTYEGVKQCADGEKALVFMLNGVEDPAALFREIADRDRLLVSFGSEDVLAEWETVGQQACVASKKC